MIPLAALPALNACLNAASALLLLAGFAAIRRRRVAVHRACMVIAFAVSVAFLVSYLTYHAHAGTTRFAGEGWIRPLYFTILTTHTVLAALVPPLAIGTLVLAFRGRFARHTRLARWTLPAWLYVSVTGVVIYAMLYHLYPREVASVELRRATTTAPASVAAPKPSATTSDGASGGCAAAACGPPR